jgi:hypothetical protein
MISEAGIILRFRLCNKYADNVDVDKRWKEWIEFETSIITNYGKKRNYTRKTNKGTHIASLYCYQLNDQL